MSGVGGFLDKPVSDVRTLVGNKTVNALFFTVDVCSGEFISENQENQMTTRSANRPGGWILTSVRWMTGIFFVTAALFGAHAKAAANTSAYVTNEGNNTVSVISTTNNLLWLRFRWGRSLPEWPSPRMEPTPM